MCPCAAWHSFGRSLQWRPCCRENGSRPFMAISLGTAPRQHDSFDRYPLSDRRGWAPAAKASAGRRSQPKRRREPGAHLHNPGGHPARRRPASLAGPIAPSVSRLHPVRPEPQRDYKCNVSLNDAAARHRSTGAPHHFFIIMSIMACMSFMLTMPLLPFFILSYMDS